MWALIKCSIYFNFKNEIRDGVLHSTALRLFLLHFLLFLHILSSSFIFSPPPHSFSSSPPPSGSDLLLKSYFSFSTCTSTLPHVYFRIKKRNGGIQLCFNLHAHAPSLITPASLRFSMRIAMALGRATDASPPSLSPKLCHQTAEFRHWSICLCLC